MSHKRLFLAIDLPGEVKEFIKEKTSQIQIPGRWTKDENLHITVHFFGNTPEDKVEGLIEKIGNSLNEIDPFTLNITKIIQKKGKFDRMIWAGFEPSAGFSRLISALYKELHLKPSRELTPHVTLARIKEKGFTWQKEPWVVGPIDFVVPAIELWESYLGGGSGPKYESIKRFELGKGY